jgi:hypothetical protein
VLQIEVDELDLAVALEAAGLGVGLDADREKLARALQERVRRWLTE